MLPVVVELQFTGRAGLSIADPLPPSTPANELYQALALWWAQTQAQQYLTLAPAQQMRPTAVGWEFLDRTVSFQLAFDYTLLERLLEFYGKFGWSALERVAETVERSRDSTAETLAFVRVTQNVVAVMVAAGLVELEQRCLSYARLEWVSARKRLLSYLQEFESTTTRGGTVGLKRSQLLDRLVVLCRDYKSASNRALALGEKVEERKTKTPKHNRPPGSGFEKWYEIFAGPQRKLLADMVDLGKQIAAVFPPALLVLGELPDSILGLQTPNTTNIAKSDLIILISGRLVSLLNDVKELEATAANLPATYQLAKLLQPMFAEPRDLSQLLGLAVPPGGYEQSVIDIAFKGTETFVSAGKPVGRRDFQRLMSDPELLARFYGDDEASPRSTWTQVVLKQYHDRLSDNVRARAANEKAWRAFWTLTKRVLAGVGLLALMAIFPFGEAVALPSLILLLQFAGGTAALLGVLTMLHDTFAALTKAQTLKAEVRAAYFRLAQSDPDALYEIGALLSQSKALRSAVMSGGLILVLTLPVAHLRIVTAALNFQGALQDINGLFGRGEGDGR